jgi:hypothetical protein
MTYITEEKGKHEARRSLSFFAGASKHKEETHEDVCQKEDVGDAPGNVAMPLEIVQLVSPLCEDPEVVFLSVSPRSS